VTLNYGSFITNLISFLIVAWAVFLLVKGMNALRRQEPPAPPSTRECPHCLATIPNKATRCQQCTQTVAPVV